MTTPHFFDELSRRWQQQTLAPAGTPGQWQALLAGGSHGPVTQMIRHVWAELIAGALITAPLLVALLRMPSGWAQGLAAGLAGLGGLSLFYYYSQLQLLRQLQHSADPLRSHAAGYLRQLRGLLRLSHRASLGLTVVLAALALYGAKQFVLPALPAAATCSFLLWFGLTVAASLALVHWLTKWHIRESYGQHIDRLEAVLQELPPE
ncbi:hypothetical protein IC235_10355 [Hymenobacter sp. BT664]|uniref:Uncharacterized protein n=1 Tax=Hymenobacter montanus TaxID=2771359 RepID=A0A927GJM1_9BACT|nr:hypothetical protein [Hymenobacter montanus]MBD2768294.1 hypothetical protein [Hymenobacter montanus]